MKKRLFFIFFILSFIFSLFINFNKINIPYFGGLNKKISLDVKFKNSLEENKGSILFDGKNPENILKIDNAHFLYSLKDYKLVKKIDLKRPENVEKVIIYADKEVFFVNSFNIKEKIFSIETQKMSLKPLYDKVAISFLSFFYNFNYYIVSYLFLFLFCTKFQFSNKKLFYLMIFLTLFLRFAQLNDIPFWDDEIYTLKVASINSPLSLLFSDPGNPPFYFILFKVFSLIIKNPDFWRVSSIIFGSIFNIIFYIYLKKALNHKASNIGLFIVSVNIVLIYFSQELRCYMLLMLLSVLSALFLFNFKGKNKLYYFLSSTALLYTHFYGAFLVLYNFIFGFFFYFNKKRKVDFIKITFLNFLTFLPLLFFKKESITSDFNSWLTPPDLVDIMLVFETFSGKALLFLIFLVICILVLKSVKKRKEKVFVFYNFFAILFVFMCAFIFSYVVKPIFCYRYFYVVYPCYIALVSYFVACNYKFKGENLVKVLFIIFFALYSRVNYQNLFCNHNIYLKFIQNDINYNMNNYIFMSDTVEGYYGFEKIFKNKKNTKIIYLPVNKGIKEIDFNMYDLKKPFCAYVLNLYLKDDIINNAYSIELYKTPLGVFSKTILNDKE